ncbi:MAG: methylated-DNA--[protein]-cysteine S-methyltransferase [candidate division Zixibacteria bacterium]|nr:methylated-DNA--[protein]-cysteine S-methyltransferase [candidate division Zixibacteria bacterium]MBU1471267.1 methylated-DNA--[protein]-cysteine S-methyltransferase [candidate division Zixibacteria bacterium]
MATDNIVYRDIRSPLGDMIAGATDSGVCFLEWHDRGGVERIKKRIEKRYRLPLTPGNNSHLDELEEEVTRYFDGKLKEFSVALDIKGTPFERSTWDQLLAIPYGKTRSYGQMADLLGKPRASRAVGRANGANYISIVVPCHRVIATNGGLGGYGGGIQRKRYLLDLEAEK